MHFAAAAQVLLHESDQWSGNSDEKLSADQYIGHCDARFVLCVNQQPAPLMSPEPARHN
jgi:hypothetical protein